MMRLAASFAIAVLERSAAQASGGPPTPPLDSNWSAETQFAVRSCAGRPPRRGRRHMRARRTVFDCPMSETEGALQRRDYVGGRQHAGGLELRRGPRGAETGAHRACRQPASGDPQGSQAISARDCAGVWRVDPGRDSNRQALCSTEEYDVAHAAG
jgi:hypothetical protein